MQTMSRGKNGSAGLAKSTIVLTCLLGLGLGMLLATVGAPLWLYYVASLSMTPILIHESRRGAADEARLKSHDRH